MKILVMGAGAIGAYFGEKLLRVGENVVFCARGAHLESLKISNTLLVREIDGRYRAVSIVVTGDPEEYAPYDLILFCVKAHDLYAAAQQIQRCLAPKGVILTLINGIESEQRLCRYFTNRKIILSGTARVGAELARPGVVQYYTPGGIEFGELDKRKRRSPRTKRIAEMFERAGILKELSLDIRKLKYRKWIWNLAFNSWTTLRLRTVGEILDDPQDRLTVSRLMEEALLLAQAEGVDLRANCIQKLFDHSEKFLRPLKTSMQQDRLHGKPLEYDALTGAGIRIAERHNISVPYIKKVHAALELLNKVPS